MPFGYFMSLFPKFLAIFNYFFVFPKVLAGKLTSPFVAKAVAAGGGALAGSVAGPMGTVIGATLGLGIDYSVNAGIELMKREEFIKDVTQVVEATKSDYYHVLEHELHRAVRVWTEDAIQLLPSMKMSSIKAENKEGRNSEAEIINGPRVNTEK